MPELWKVKKWLDVSCVENVDESASLRKYLFKIRQFWFVFSSKTVVFVWFLQKFIFFNRQILWTSNRVGCLHVGVSWITFFVFETVERIKWSTTCWCWFCLDWTSLQTIKSNHFIISSFHPSNSIFQLYFWHLLSKIIFLLPRWRKVITDVDLL